VHLAFDIFQGIGISAAIGIRPFVPSFAAGALAAGSVEIHFQHTSYSFLQSLPFLLVMVICAALLIMLDPDNRGPRLYGVSLTVGLTVVSLGLGGLFFAGALVRDHHPSWPGWIGGVICAGIGLAASRPFLARLRSRLDDAAASVGLPLISDGSALLIALLAIVAPPLGLVALLLLVWLLFAGRGRSDAKYAGLRILR